MMMGGGPALAHDKLISSSPSDGETVAVVPEQVTLTFSNKALALGSTVVVNGPDGEAQSGPVAINGPVVTQRLSDVLPAGSYEVVWRVVSSDGHPITDSFTFVATSGRSPATPTTSPAATAAPVTSSPSSASPQASVSGSPTTSSTPSTSPEPGTPDAEGERSSAPWLVGGVAAAALLAAAVVWRRRD